MARFLYRLDAISHKLHLPEFLQRRICDALDRQHGWTGTAV